MRWHTPGLAAAAAAEPDSYRCIPPWRKDRPTGTGAGRHRIERAGGLLTFAAKPPVLRDWAVAVYGLGEPPHSPMDYIYLGWDWPNGEVQIFDDYRQGVSAARVARREVLAELPHPVPPADLQPLIWQRAAEVRLRAR